MKTIKSTENRRPLTTRSMLWAKWLANICVKCNLSPNSISVFSIVPALVGAGLLMKQPTPFMLILVALCIQLRLLANMLDGMVAIEGGKQSNVGILYNEIPDRIADSLLIVALGYAIAMPWLGWLGALFAAKTAYIRVLGGAIGLKQDFRGPLAKPHRMFVMTLGCLLAACNFSFFGTQQILLVTADIIAIGAGITCITRTLAIAKQLKAQP